MGDFSIKFTRLYFKSKFLTSGLFILKSGMSTNKNFPQTCQKKKLAELDGLQELVAEDSPIRNDVPSSS